MYNIFVAVGAMWCHCGFIGFAHSAFAEFGQLGGEAHVVAAFVISLRHGHHAQYPSFNHIGGPAASGVVPEGCLPWLATAPGTTF